MEMNTRKRKASIQDTKYTQPDNKNMRYTRMQKIHQDQTHKEKDVEYIEPDSKKSRHIRMQKMQKKRKREEENNSDDMQRALKQQCPNIKNNSDDMQIPLKQRCLHIDHRHLYLSSSHGMVSFTPEYIQHLKETYNERSYLGLPEYNCKYCNAMFWYHEQNKEDTRKNKEIMYSNCCKYGQIKLPPFKEPPQFLARLLNYKEPLSKHFMQKIRQYNSLFAFTSMGGNIDKNINKGEGPYVFRVNGQIHHRIGSLLPQPEKMPKFAELYIFDTKNEIENRIRALHKQDPEENDINPYIVEQLKKMLDEYNPLVKTFRHARDILEEHNGIDISIRIIGASKDSAIQYEMPHTEELAIVIVGDLNVENYKRDIIISNKNKGLQRICIFHPAYMPLQYPLLFPYGERGFQLGIAYQKKETKKNMKTKRTTVTMHEFFKYHMHFRPNQPNPYLCYGRLSKQAIVDARAMEDEDRLMFIARNQDKLRAEYLQGIFDAVEKGLSDANQIGKRTLLPSSHTGSRRYVIQNYHDGIAICRVYGPPDLFITFTCNSKWPEITATILEGQHPNDRPDIIVRVFHMKLQELLHDIRSGSIFGPIVAILYSIEFQKRGLPHVHILVWLDKNGNEITPEMIDKWISAEIPDPSEDPLGYVLISEHMMHGPCGEKK